MKILFSIIFFINFLWANSENVSMMNQVKNVIQKEEYIALAINKYILQTATIPKKEDNTLDWTKLLTDEYLGSNFNKTNPHTSNDMKIIFDTNNSAYIQGIIEEEDEYNSDDRYLYNFYINKLFRVNTIPSFDTSKEKLVIGSQILYSDIQKEIVSLINENNASKKIKLATQTCETDNYFYELSNGELIYKYCKSETSSITVYQDAPIYLEDWKDLQYVKANIGDKAYVKKNGSWYEYYYQGDSSIKWIASGIGDALTSVNETIDLEDRILSYIPDSKDLILRSDGGCMLANGDIFCWGNNLYKKAGIESYGQLDKTLSPDYVNTPVMLKAQISDSTQKAYNWYNNPYRIKFEKMSMNSTNVCGVSPIFNYFSGVQKKFGGDLYCNGLISSVYFEDIGTSTETSILKRNKFFYTDKADELENSSEIYLKDIVMVNDVVAVLSDAGKIYTFGTNYSGALGIGETNLSFVQKNPTEVKNTGQVFKKIFALRDIRGFGAIDNAGYFYIWGERPNGKYYTEPTLLLNSIQFNADAIFTNSKDFVLKGVNDVFYRTDGDRNFRALTQIPNTAVSASIYDDNGSELYLYIDKNLVLHGSDDLLECRYADGGICSTTDGNIFTSAMAELNTASNLINGTNYANFSNVSIFESKTNKIVIDYGEDYNENFENSSATGWNVSYIHDGESVTGKFLGRLGDGRIDMGESQTVYKTFSLGSEWANANIRISFDMYEIGTWDGSGSSGYEDAFLVFINDEMITRDTYSYPDENGNEKDVKEGTDLGILANSGNNPIEKHVYKYSIKLDSQGRFKLGFGATLGGWNKRAKKDADYTVESFGINNINISKQIDNTLLSSGTYLENFEDGNHDFWVVPPGPVPYTKSDSEFYEYPIYTDSGTATKFLGRFGKKSNNNVIYHGNNKGTEEVYKIFSFGAENANKQVKIEYDFYRIDTWTYKPDDTSNGVVDIDKFYTFINGIGELTYSTNDSVTLSNLNKIDNTSNTADYKIHFSRTEYLDEYGNIRLGFGVFFKYAYMDTASWGIDNVQFTLTGNTNGSGSGSNSSTKEVGVPYLCAMTGLGSASQMYCWGGAGRALPILSTSLYDVGNMSTINRLFVTPKGKVNERMSFINFNDKGNSDEGSLFLKYPTYLGGFDYEFYFK